MEDLSLKIVHAFRNEMTEDLEVLLLHLPSFEVLVQGLSPLSMAVMLNGKELVSKLLKQGADPNFRNEDKSTALTFSRDLEITGLLLENGASARFESESELETSVHIACGQDDLVAVKTLIERGEGSYCSRTLDEFGRTPLAVAVQHGSLALVQLLLQSGFPVDYTDSIGGALTPLQLAIQLGRAEVVEALLDAGADVQLRHGLSRAPLDMARRNPTIQEVLRKHMTHT